MILNSDTGQLLVTQKSVQVHIDPGTRRPERLPEHLRKVIIDYEGSDVELID
jgi:acyl-CoA thioesterase FadM